MARRQTTKAATPKATATSTTTKTRTRKTNEDKVTLLQTKIDSHKKHITNLEKQKNALMKEIDNKAVSELASFIHKKNISVNEAKKLINQSIKMPVPTPRDEAPRPNA